MRRASAVWLLILACAPVACKRQRPTVQTIEEEGPALATVVRMADPHAAGQLLSGFYPIEQNAWRWTAGHFSVLLHTPRGAAQNGATLHLTFSVPEGVIAKLRSISLSASVNGTPLGAESYTKSGQFTYSRDVPARAMHGGSAKVDFALDKALPPTPSDQRELGVVAASVGFEAK
jgi:hypothetical protein